MLELKTYEKATVLMFLFPLLLLSLHTLNAPVERWPHEKYPERKKQIVVTITGEIEEEGRYHFQEGAKVADVLNEVALKPHANTQHLKLGQPLKPGQKIRIKKAIRKKT